MINNTGFFIVTAQFITVHNSSMLKKFWACSWFSLIATSFVMENFGKRQRKVTIFIIKSLLIISSLLGNSILYTWFLFNNLLIYAQEKKLSDKYIVKYEIPINRAFSVAMAPVAETGDCKGKAVRNEFLQRWLMWYLCRAWSSTAKSNRFLSMRMTKKSFPSGQHFLQRQNRCWLFVFLF